MKTGFLNYYTSILLYLFINLFIFINLYTMYPWQVLISFSILSIILVTLSGITFVCKNTVFDGILVIFYILFFFIAPILQLNQNNYPIPFPINTNYIVMANIINSIFLFVYIIFRFFIFNKIHLFKLYKKNFHLSNFNILFIALIFFIFLIPQIPDMLNKIINKANYISNENQIQNLIYSKFYLFIPLMYVYYYLNKYKTNKNKKILLLFIFWLIILIFCKNPFNEKRNALGPIYLSLIFFYIQDRLNVRNMTFIATILIVIGLPLSSILTHSTIGLVDIFSSRININKNLIIEQFTQLHFDAFANLNVAIDYTNNYGISYGWNLLSALLFFIPRSAWSMKALNSGMIIGNYLISDYGYHYNNLSCTYTAEAFINGGILGVVIFSIIYASISKFVFELISQKNYYSLIGWYISIHSFFLLRGDLMNGIAYLIGPLLAIWGVPYVINKIFRIRIRIIG